MHCSKAIQKQTGHYAVIDNRLEFYTPHKVEISAQHFQDWFL